MGMEDAWLASTRSQPDAGASVIATASQEFLKSPAFKALRVFGRSIIKIR
jgi:hypothetical protein